jgi:hypothetical protein
MLLAWDKTIYLFGSYHSITLILTAFFFGMISIGSNIVWIPYVSSFGNQYLPAYFVGASFCGLIPSGLGIIQGTSSYTCKLSPETNQIKPVFNDPHFSVSTFYGIVFLWACGSVISFFILDKYFRQEENIVKKEEEVSEFRGILRRNDVCLLVSIALLAAQVDTVLPSIQTYALLSYSQETYFWAIVFSTLIQPISAFIGGVLPTHKISYISILLLLCTFSTSMTVVIAFQSPNPWLKTSIWGSVISVRRD